MENESPTSTREFDGWVNEDELEDGYTVIHISENWEVVSPEEANNWNPDTVEIFRRGICKRYFVYENIPSDYEIYNQGQCAEGVTVSVYDGEGRMITQIILPKKEVDG